MNLHCGFVLKTQVLIGARALLCSKDVRSTIGITALIPLFYESPRLKDQFYYMIYT